MWVLPTDEKAFSKTYPLRATDTLYLRSPHVAIGYRFDEILDVDGLKNGMQEAINRIPVYAGRIRKFQKVPQFRITLEGSKGAFLEIRDAKPNESVPETASNPGTNSWSPFFFATKDVLFESTSSDPGVSARVVFFREENITILTTSFTHSFGDGDAITLFLNTWSHFCGGPNPLPGKEPPLPVLDRSVKFDEAILETVQDREVRLSSSELSTVPTAAIVNAFRTVILDFTIKIGEVKAMKDKVGAMLPEGKWVSSYEVMMAMLLKLLHIADYGKKAGSRTITTRILTNTRSRNNIDVANYIGNALAFVPLNIPATAHSSGNWLADTALFIHDSLRKQLGEKDKLDEIHYQFESQVRKGALGGAISRLALTRPFYLHLLTTLSVCNSWLGYNWFDVTFSGSGKPSLMHVPKSFSMRRMNFVAPRTPFEVLVRMHLSKARAARFKRAVEELEMPLVWLDEGPKPRLSSRFPSLPIKNPLAFLTEPRETVLVAGNPEEIF